MSFHQFRSPYFNNVLNYPQVVTVPDVTTQAATSIGSTTATGNGTLNSNGGSAITAMGFVWSTSANPTLSDNVVTVGTTTGAYTGSLTGLPSSTTIHYRAYATNAIGTTYGADTTFATSAPSVNTGSNLLLMGVG